MTRIVLNYVLPLLIPVAVYFAWVWYSRRRQKEGEPIAKAEDPWFWILTAGFVLMAGGLVYLALSDKGDADGNYQAPRLEGGEVVPGEVK
tara:strand:+ start:223 stop:492 length:270 start_codon:yes stop_codon:yes gene_type:complete